MNFSHKCHHPQNFVFGGSYKKNTVTAGSSRCTASLRAWENGVYHLRLGNSDLWPRDYCSTEFTIPQNALLRQSRSPLQISPEFDLELRNSAGKPVLQSLPGASFGLCGSSWLFQFVQTPQMQFFGMGEKSTPFEKSRRTHRFWNTDSWADFHFPQVRDGHYDPDYISVPYVIIKQHNEYTGVLVDNPHSSFISVSPKMVISNQLKSAEIPVPFFYVGADHGAPSIYILHGPSLQELTRKFQNLIGKVTRPPLWALGYHQCRWGYRGTADLNNLADNFEKHAIPADGLWLDIDYMDGYRVFTYSKEHFSDPAKELTSIRKRGYHVVPIIDPGVKRERGNKVYDSGKRKDVFCKNQTARDFIGLVWPGYTVFPDFSLEETRRWWARHVAEFARSGQINGAWLDMNDPSTGSIDCNAMLFDRGHAPHHAYHNQYASLMAKATREGFLSAFPDQRPFLISRSGFTGSQQYCGHWQGDNYSNYHHLGVAIGKTLNMSLSGMPMNAPDIGGFGGNTTEPLMLDWIRMCFLFPFLRNHSSCHTRPQEPWAFSSQALRIIRSYIRFRYKLIPYLYNLYIGHERFGDPIVRPLFYDFDDSRKLPLTVDNQFMIGPWIMQAPFVDETDSRTVVLPSGNWYCAETGRWIRGGKVITVKRTAASTPLYFREGALIAMQQGKCRDNRKDLRRIDLLVALAKTSKGLFTSEYSFDDGESFGYLDGASSRCSITAHVRSRALHLEIKHLERGHGEVSINPVTLEKYDKVIISIDGVGRTLETSSGRRMQSLPIGSSLYHWR